MLRIYTAMATELRANEAEKSAISYIEQIRNNCPQPGGKQVPNRFFNGSCIRNASCSVCNANLVHPSTSMSSKRLESLGDYLRHGYRIRLECLSCNRVVIKPVVPLLRMCRERGVSHRLVLLEKQLRCSKCGLRDVRIGPAFEEP